MMKTIHPFGIVADAPWPRVGGPLVFTFQPGATKPSG
jgi:hypothetical protein